jgi:hypothetical protein
MKLLLLVLSAISGLCYSQLQLEEEWFTWKRQHSKFYNTAENEGSRWKVWRDNYQKIQEHNKGNHSFSLGLNEFADMVKAAKFLVGKKICTIICIIFLDARRVFLLLPVHSKACL